VRDAMVPNLILQPIVENAMKHGVSHASGTGSITLRARREGEVVIVSVTDNGPGPGGGDEGVGLRNTNARLRELYGASYSVTLRAAQEGGTEAQLRIPYHTTPVTTAVLET
jgi:two-component system, LytTR family, sensor kinase